ncbi:glutathione S-transferase family protein [Novosphingobium sp.]|uniref:glutathione S-transferase family protein n=1 Tax=Novosphingobium sp. TaxID=1874826 RepID=UPI003D10FC32
MKLVIGNRRYSSWSLRGWLACRQSGLPFDVEVVSLYDADWNQEQRTNPLLAPSAGKVPILWDGETVVWDSLAIMDYLVDRLVDDGVGRERFWPQGRAAAALARSLVAEMHGGFVALRSAMPFNLGRNGAPVPLSDAVVADIDRMLTLWAEARARFGQGGPYLLGTFGAADIAFAPVALRFVSYGVALPGFAQSYVAALNEHPWIVAWRAQADAEPWTIERFEIA